MFQPAATWHVEGHSALLECGPLRGSVVCNPPSLGFLPERWNGQAFHQAAMLDTGGPTDDPELLQPAEAYVRGADFVLTYAKSSPGSIAWQTYWRASFEAARSVVRLELILSVQTDLLDSTPQLLIGSNVGGSELFHASELSVDEFRPVAAAARIDPIMGRDSRTHLFAFRIRPLGLTYAEMVHPSDFVWAGPTAGEGLYFSVTSGLFPERLEKGVIRRARVCGWFLPAENDLAVAVDLARQFIAEPLPLTA